MKILISPAKSLDFKTSVPTGMHTNSNFLAESERINKVLRGLKAAELASLMSISSTLANLNFERNKEWQTPFTLENARQAVFAFNGEVYSGLDIHSLNSNKYNVLQQKVRIISGLYGLLKPFDLIQAYRLEMGTKIEIDKSQNLYEFWKPKIIKALQAEMFENELIVNLASNEYFTAIDTRQIKNQIVTPEFKDYKNGSLKTISFFAKRARGLMVRYIIDHDIENIDGLKSFNTDGYFFDENLSTTNRLIFTR